MGRCTRIENTSPDNVTVKLTGGPEITLPPNSRLENVDVENINSLSGKVSVKEDLTEIKGSRGKTRIDECQT